MDELLDRNFAVPSLCDALVICTWNVRGLTDLKLFELILHMKRYDIDILCIQERMYAVLKSRTSRDIQ